MIKKALVQTYILILLKKKPSAIIKNVLSSLLTSLTRNCLLHAERVTQILKSCKIAKIQEKNYHYICRSQATGPMPLTIKRYQTKKQYKRILYLI